MSKEKEDKTTNEYENLKSHINIDKQDLQNGKKKQKRKKINEKGKN